MSLAEHLYSLNEFVSHSSPLVRIRALELAHVFSVDKDISEISEDPVMIELLGKLLDLSKDLTSGSRTIAFEVLVNLAGSEAIVNQAFAALDINSIVETILLNIFAPHNSAADGACMLLQNLTRADLLNQYLVQETDPDLLAIMKNTAMELLEDLTESPRIERLSSLIFSANMTTLERLVFLLCASGDPATVSEWNDKADFSALATSLGNLMRDATAQKIITHETQGSPGLLSRLISMLHSSYLNRRIGVAIIIKNVTLGNSDVIKTLANPESPMFVVEELLLAILRVFGCADNGELPPRLIKLLGENKDGASNGSDDLFKIVLIDALTALTAIPYGRSALRIHGGYEVMRNCYNWLQDNEDAEGYSELIGVVEMLISVIITNDEDLDEPSR